LKDLVKQVPLPIVRLSNFLASIDRLKSEFENRFKLVMLSLMFPNSKRNERMNTDEQVLMQSGRGAGMVLTAILFSICVIITFVGIGFTSYGIFKILDTTPFMGIMVDAQGNRLPIEGYPFLWSGIAITVISSILTFIAGYNILQRREAAVMSRLVNPMDPIATRSVRARCFHRY
jgi:hypothetical protein